ncbi:hypothetical protein [Psychrobacter alimentarius]|uniref:hypothetical protein n=1 Tax=Psychrobacter alimentarius TaxID=261164 RepID=UPI00334763A0
MNQILKFYSLLGESLKNNGIDEKALPISEANRILDLYLSNNILVLGGDLYVKKMDKGFELFYADWFYEGDSVEDGINKAKSYLEQFGGKDLYVSFVVE